MTQLKDTVTTAIKEKNIAMHSRAYFMWRTALWVLSVLIVFGLALFLVSLFGFIFRANGLHLLPFFGAHGISTLFFSLPWMLLLGIALVFIVLQLLSRHFSFVYKRPLVHTVLASIVIVIIGGIALTYTTLHDRALEYARGPSGLPIAGPFYRAAIADRPEVHIGTVHAITPEGFTLERRDGTVVNVATTTDTRIPPSFTLTLGAPLMVLGDAENDIIDAVGIRPAHEQGIAFPPKKRRSAAPAPAATE